MPVFELTSPSGAVYEVEGPDAELSPELLKQFQDSITLAESDTGQGIPATVFNAGVQGLTQTGTGIVGGLGALQDLVQDEPSYLTTAAQDIQGTVAANFPTNPANPVAAGVGQAIGQAAGQLGIMGGGIVTGVAPQIISKLGLGTAALQGAQQGEQRAKELGLTGGDRALATLGYGAAELGSEMVGGLGTTKFVKSFLPPAATDVVEGAGKRFLKTAIGEAAEEPLAGGLEAGIDLGLAAPDPQRPGYALSGAPLPELASPEFWQNRAEEFGYGLVGGAVFGGAHAALGNRQAVPAPVPQTAAATAAAGAPQTAQALVDVTAASRLSEIEADDARSKLAEEVEAGMKAAEVIDPLAVVPPVVTAPSEVVPPVAEVPVVVEPAAEVIPAPPVEEPPAPIPEATIPATSEPEIPAPSPAVAVTEADILPDISAVDEPAPVAEEIPEAVPAPAIEEVAASEPPPIPEAPIIYTPEPIPEGGTIKPDHQTPRGVTAIRYPMVTYYDDRGKKVTRPYFTNDPTKTYAQLSAGKPPIVPRGTVPHPDIVVGNNSQVTGVWREVNGSRRLITSQAEAKQAFLDDQTVTNNSQRQAEANAAKTAAAISAKVERVGELSAFENETEYAKQVLPKITAAINQAASNLSPVARDNAVSEAFQKHIEDKRIEAFIKAKGDPATLKNKKLRQRISDWTPGQANIGPAVQFAVQQAVHEDASAPVTQALVGNEAGDAAVTQAEDDVQAGINEPAPALQPVTAPDKSRASLAERVSVISEKTEPKLKKVVSKMEADIQHAAEVNAQIAKDILDAHDALIQIAGLPADTMLPLSEAEAAARKAEPDLATWPAKTRQLVERFKQLKQYRPLNGTPLPNIEARKQEAERLGLKEGDPATIRAALQRVANNATGMRYHAHLTMVAKLLLKASDAAFAGIKGLNFTLAQGEYAGLYSPATQEISFNMENDWGGDLSLGQVLVHEFGHHLSWYKLRFPANEFETELGREIEATRKRVEEYLRQVRPEELEKPYAEYILGSNDEFITGVLSEPNFVEMLNTLPPNLVAGEKAVGKESLIGRMLRKLWALLTGKRVAAGSPVDRAMKSVFSLIETPWTIPTEENIFRWVFGEEDEQGMKLFDRFKSTAGMNRYEQTSKPLFGKVDEATGYKASGAMFGSGRKDSFIAEAERRKDALKTKAAVESRVITRDILSAGKSEYGKKSAIPWDTVATAMGDNENKIDPVYLKTLTDARNKTLQSALGTRLAGMNAATTIANQQTVQATWLAEKTRIENAHAADLQTARVDYFNRVRAAQAAALAALQPKTRAAVQEGRDKLTALQDELIQSGFLNGALVPHVTESRGLYLHRSYQFRDDPAWGKFVLGTSAEAQRIRTKAATLIEQELVAAKAAELRRAAPGTLTPAQALAQAATLVTPRDVQAGIEELVHLPDKDLVSSFAGSAGAGKPSSILKARDDIHPAIQELWGKYNDPLINATKSYGLISAYLAGQRMIRDIVQNGVAQSYIFTEQNARDNLVPLVEDSVENKRKYRALFQKKMVNGQEELGNPYYGPPLLHDALQDLGGQMQNTSGWRAWTEAFRAATGYAMAAATVYSVQATARDFLSNLTLMAMNGHLPFIPGGVSWKSFKLGLSLNAREAGIDSLFEWLLSPVRGKNAPPLLDHAKLDKYLGRLVELRVLGDTRYEGVVRELTSGASKRFDLRGADVNKAMQVLYKGLSWTNEKAQAFRALSDNIPKAWVFESEKNRLRKFFPNMSEAEAEEKAAAKVRATTPTYSQGSDFVKMMRRQPIGAPFFSFVGETLRIPAQTYKLAWQEMRSKSKGEQAIGAIRMVNLAAMLTVLPYLLSAAVKMLRDPEDKDSELSTDKIQEALARFVSPWQKNNQLVWLGRDGNKHSYLDSSYLFPLDLPQSVLSAAFHELVTDPENATAALKASNTLSEVYDRVSKPFKEQILLGSIIDVARNQRSSESDQELYNAKLDSWADKAVTSLGHIARVFEPGTLKTAERIVKGIRQEVDPSGRAYSTREELAAAIGAKVMRQDIETRLMRLGNQRKQVLGDAMQFASLPFTSVGTQAEEDLANSIARMNDGRRDTLKEMRLDYLAALNLGMDRKTAVSSLKQSSLTDDEVAMVLSNQYLRKTLSDDVLRRAAAEGAKLNQKRLEIYRQAIAGYPASQRMTEE